MTGSKESELRTDEYIIKEVTPEDGYEQLRALWCGVFGDPPEYVDSVYRIFDEDIKGYAVFDAEGTALSALSCYRCGEIEGRPVYVSYAVCTAESARGRGLAGTLTEYVRDAVLAEGGVSIVSPAEPSLTDFYGRHGYEPFFFASQRSVMNPDLDAEEYEDFDDFDLDPGLYESGPASPELELKPVSAAIYNRYREAFLSVRPHVSLSEPMLRLVESESMKGKGLLAINGGDAICAVSEAGPGGVLITELIVNPILLEISMEIEGEIAALTAKKFDAAEAIYSVPGGGRCQSMAAGIPEQDEQKAYFGFPVE